ncbi:nitroreductase/quinone reductase family protein [Streptomyces sp. NPDC056500]|uniref:nitroreductase/quinone reductase family protein n=1 Tax=Streptomyces sp. NPDC056500 TaxID=3345840 RepID=UPI0036A5B2E2
MPNDFNQQIIEEFRARGGVVGGPFEGARLLLLTTTGARSGASHTTPVAYLPDADDRVLVIASAAGAPRHPAWFHNLLVNPRVTVEAGVFTYEAQATVLVGAERDAAFARAVESDAGWADYQAKTDRVIPVIALREIPAGPPNIAASSPGEAIKLIHEGFRHELALIRDEVRRSGPRVGAQLRINCLAMCQGLHNHHTGEDTMMFPALARHHPEAAPVLERLEQEHEKIAVLIEDLQRVISIEDSDPVVLLTEVERLTWALEDHLTYEEEQLIPLLAG